MKTLFLLLAFSSLSTALLAQGTLLKDIYPGGGGAGSHPGNLTVMGNTLYFSATTLSSGAELWKTDGTAKGTLLVKDVRPGKNGCLPSTFTVAGNKLFFLADDGTHGLELWRTDGTAAGTILLKDIFPGSGASLSAYKPELTAVGNTLFFIANDSIHGKELWQSDGTPAGTRLLRDFRAGTADGCLESMTSFNNAGEAQLYFTRRLPNSTGVDFGAMYRYSPSTKKYATLFSVKGEYMSDLMTHAGKLFYGQSNLNGYEYLDIHRMNTDQKGGAKVFNSKSFLSYQMESRPPFLVQLDAEEYFPYQATLRNPDTGEEMGSLGDGVRFMTVLNGELYSGSRGNGEGVEDGYSVQRGFYGSFDSRTVTVLGVFKGSIEGLIAYKGKLFVSAYTSANGSELRYFTVSAPAAREEAEEREILSAFPNPATSQVNVTFAAREDGPMDVDLFDINGNHLRTIFQGEMLAGESRSEEVNTVAFANGLYLVRMKGVQYNKFLKLAITK